MVLYDANPGSYSQASYSNLKTGRICAIIGIVLQGIVILIYGAMAVFIVSEASRGIH